jgi:signal transduction histidine kinase
VNFKTTAPNTQSWQHAADAMPQLICLVDQSGRVLQANRTLARWQLGEPEQARSLDLHQALHADCSDPDCYLRLYWQRTALLLGQYGRSDYHVWDARLKRHLEIRALLPLANEDLGAESFFAVLTIDDVSQLKASGQEIRAQLTQLSHQDEHGQLSGFSLMGRDMSEWVHTEEALRVTQNEVWRLTAQHLTIQENERRRIALDLHDGLGQTLSLVKLSIEEATRSMSAGSSDRAAQTLAGLGPTVKSALTELRRISMNLRPSTLDDLGILATLSWYFREFESACPDLRLQREVTVVEADVPDLLKITIFRIVQEATGNALKHANADRLLVSLQSQDGALCLLIEDNGQGFDPELASSKHEFGSGLGLQSMRERAELSGANYAFSAAPGKGTRIEVRWPTPGAFQHGLETLAQAGANIQQLRSPIDRRAAQRYFQCLACLQRLSAS